MVNENLKCYNFTVMIITPEGMTQDEVTQHFDLLFDTMAEEKGIFAAASFLNEIEVNNAL